MTTWTRIAEQIMLSAVESKIRMLGFTAPVSGSGTSAVAREVAEAFARSGRKTLFLDLTTAVRPSLAPGVWTPGSGDALAAVSVLPSGLMVLEADATEGSRKLFNNTDYLQRMTSEELAEFSAIVMDLPAVREDEPSRLNPLAAARLADAVLMVCLTGHIDRSQLSTAVEGMKPAGAKLAGLVLKHYFPPTPCPDISTATTRTLGRLMPGLARRIAGSARSSRFLNDDFIYVP